MKRLCLNECFKIYKMYEGITEKGLVSWLKDIGSWWFILKIMNFAFFISIKKIFKNNWIEYIINWFSKIWTKFKYFPIASCSSISFIQLICNIPHSSAALEIRFHAIRLDYISASLVFHCTEVARINEFYDYTYPLSNFIGRKQDQTCLKYIKSVWREFFCVCIFLFFFFCRFYKPIQDKHSHKSN